MDWSNSMAAIVASQQDMHELVSRWKELLDVNPADVTFEFFDNSMYTIPNFAKLGLSKLTAYREITAATTELTWVQNSVSAGSPGLQQISSDFPIASTYPLDAIRGSNEFARLNGVVIPYYTARWYRPGVEGYIQDPDLTDFMAMSASARFVTTGAFYVSEENTFEMKSPDTIRAVEAPDSMTPDALLNYGHHLSVMANYSKRTNTWLLDFNMRVRFNHAAIEHCKEAYPVKTTNVLSASKHLQGDVVVDGIYPYNFYRCMTATGSALSAGPGMLNYRECPSNQGNNKWRLWGSQYRGTHNLEISLTRFEILLPFSDTCDIPWGGETGIFAGGAHPPFEGFGALTNVSRGSAPVVSMDDGSVVGKATMMPSQDPIKIQARERLMDTAAVKPSGEKGIQDYFRHSNIIQVDLVKPVPVCEYYPNTEHAVKLSDSLFDVACRGMVCPAGRGLLQKFGVYLGVQS